MRISRLGQVLSLTVSPAKVCRLETDNKEFRRTREKTKGTFLAVLKANSTLISEMSGFSF